MHQTVLLREAVDALVTNPAGFYVDGTFGRGGHSQCLLTQLDARGRVLGVDKDPMACETAEMLAGGDTRFQLPWVICPTPPSTASVGDRRS